MKKIFLPILLCGFAWAQNPNSANYPTSVPSLPVASPAAQSTLNGAMDASQTTATVANASGFRTPVIIAIGSERIYCLTKSTNQFTSCTRGFDGTTAATHPNSASVTGQIPSYLLNQMSAELMSIGSRGTILWTSGAGTPVAACTAPGLRNLSAYTNTSTGELWLCTASNSWTKLRTPADTVPPGGTTGQIQVNGGTSLTGADPQGSGPKVQMAAGTPGTAGTVNVYDSAGNVIGGGCSISGSAITCGSLTESHAISFPELSANGANKFSLYGADIQSADGCVVLPVGPSSTGQVMQDSGSTATMTDGSVCRVLSWATLSGSGTVTSINVSAPAPLTASGGPVISTGTVALAWATGQPSGKVVGTCGSATTFGSCSLVPGDLPQLVAANMPAYTGDVAASAGSTSTALATVNPNTGSCGDATHSCQVSLDGKGRVTSATAVTITGGGGGGGGVGNPYSQTFTCSSSPTSIMAATHLQGLYPILKFRDANNLPTAAGLTTLAANGDVTVACGNLSVGLTVYISGAVGSAANAAAVFASATSPVVVQDQHGFGNTNLEVQTWDSQTPRQLMAADTTSIDATNFSVTLSFATAQAGLAVIAQR